MDYSFLTKTGLRQLIALQVVPNRVNAVFFFVNFLKYNCCMCCICVL